MIDKVILYLLGLITLRDIVASTGIVEYSDKLYSKLLYGNFSKVVIKKALFELGFSNFTEIERNVKGISLKQRINMDACDSRKHIHKLVGLLGKYTLVYDEDSAFGKDASISTPYYINTMEASRNKNDLEVMIELLEYLFLIALKDGHIPKMPDFIITPKNGNVLLSSKLAEKHGLHSIFIKGEGDSSKIKSLDYQHVRRFESNFEGSIQLIEHSHKLNENKDNLFGVAIDCNISSGNGIINAMKEFNGILNNLSLKIDPVKNAFILYRIDDNKTIIDKKFENENFTLRRYIDVPESSKKYLSKMSRKKIDSFNTKHMKLINDVVENIEVKHTCHKSIEV